MSALLLLILLSLAFSLGSFVLFLWAQRTGQFDLVSADGHGQGAELPLVENGETAIPQKIADTQKNQH
jgi:cbb3-type cytochrome oxidase maturation protein